jgi:hypothetical protein
MQNMCMQRNITLITKCNACKQINKYDHELDGGSKKKIKLRLIRHNLIIIR